MAIHFIASESGKPRLGLAVSRKVDATAVGRNRIKRVLRNTFRLYADLPAKDYVVVARHAAASADNAQIKQDFEKLLAQANAKQAQTAQLPQNTRLNPQALAQTTHTRA